MGLFKVLYKLKACANYMDIEQDLIERCRKKDRKAENELYKILYSFLMSVCRRYILQDEKARENKGTSQNKLQTVSNKIKPAKAVAKILLAEFERLTLIYFHGILKLCHEKYHLNFKTEL